MAHGYYISLGYDSGSSRDVSIKKDERWAKLRELALEIAADPSKLEIEARLGGSPPLVDEEGTKLLRYAQALVIDLASKDNPCVRLNDEAEQIEMMCSGGGVKSRGMKEHVRRAFCRLVIQKAHRLGLEVNLGVY